MLTGVLDPAQQELVREERAVLAALRASLIRFGASDENLAPLEQSIAQLDELFLLVVVGEFNAGKSAFINALAGERVMAEGVTPTTAQVTLLRYGDAGSISGSVALRDGYLTVTAPAELLREIHIVDTPGTNAVIREHERITAEFVPRADLVFFVTSADRPFTETERAFLEQIRDWGKKVVIVVNKVDILASPRERDEVMAYVADNARRLLGVTPEIFAVSARDAYRAKHGEPALWASSGFEPLERYVRSTLDQSARLTLKLLNPIGVGSALAERYRAVTHDRQALLAGDFALLDDVDRQLSAYESDMSRDFTGRMAAVENVLLEMERRGERFFEDTMRIGRVFDLLNRARVQQAFEQQVVAAAPQQVEQRVHELIEWLVDADHRQWDRITRHLAERRREHRERIVGDDESRPFHDERRRLIESVGGEAQRVVATYDREREARELADGARTAVAAAAAAGAGAVGLGALVTVAASTAAADVTGIILAGVVAALGFFIIPAKRNQARAEMRRKISDVRQRLAGALAARFEREIGRSVERLRESIAPYRRFVRSEGEKLHETEAQLTRLSSDLERLRTRINAIAA